MELRLQRHSLLGRRRRPLAKGGQGPCPCPFCASIADRKPLADVGRLLDRIGDKWMVLTLGLIRDKPRRFNALRRDIEGVTQKILSQTLKQMERDGLITRTVLPTMPVSVEYAITPLGQTLAAVLDGLQLYDASGRG